MVNLIKRVGIVWGTRPEHIKIYPVWKALKESGYSPITFFTGQHQDLVDHLNLSIPLDFELGVMKHNQTLNDVLAVCLKAVFEPIRTNDLALILVQGDTSSALAGALTGFYLGIRVAHVEAGLSSGQFDDPFPEEIHRRLIRELTTYHFAPTKQSVKNLRAVGVTENVFLTGNTVVDALHELGYGYPGDENSKLVLITIHRRENDKHLKHICSALNTLAGTYEDYDFQCVVHPRTKAMVTDLVDQLKINVTPATDYLSFLELLSESYCVITDSGGIQEECTVFGVPCFVVRKRTERTEAVEKGFSKVVGVDTDSIIDGVGGNFEKRFCRRRQSSRVYGDGHAGKRIAEAIDKELSAP